ncbi:MAG: ACT domain-containing protein [Propionibacteriales bacterium]|nr:ACT domain-containing protein [Propionibacteriales bacterium]
MPMLILTVVGDDRAGLVATLAEVVSAHGGNWERSELAELDGTFAGVVEVSVPAEQRDALLAALEGLDGLLKVTAHTGAATPASEWPQLSLTVIGNDRPGIVKEISGALSRHQLNIEHLSSKTVDAPMAGGRLFEATVIARVPATADTAAITADLEQLAAEIQVDLHLA